MDKIEGVIIRNYKDEDLQDAVDLWNIVWGQEIKMDIETFNLKVLNHKNFDSEGFFVADLNGKIVGFVLACIRKVALIGVCLEEETGYIPVILVHPEYRRKGVGTMLLARYL